MQVSRDMLTDEIRREVHFGKTHKELLETMDADLRPNEVVVERRELNDQEGQGLYIECIMRELLAVPAQVFERPVFAKLNRYLKNYRRFYGFKHPVQADQMPGVKK